MDTKLKNIKYSIYVKLLVFILVLISALAAIGCGLYITYNSDYFTKDKFEKTYEFRNTYEQITRDIINFELDFISEDYIIEKYQDKKERLSKLQEYKAAKARIDGNVNYIYYIKNLDNDLVKTNLSKSFTYLDDQLASIYYINSELNSINSSYSTYMYNPLRRLDELSYEFRGAVSKDLLPGDNFYTENIKFNYVREYSTYVIGACVTSLSLVFIGLIFLIITTGRSYKDSDLKLFFIDKIPFEIQFFAFIIIVASEVGILSNLYDFEDLLSVATILLSSLAISGLIALTLLLSIVRRIKDRSFFKNFLIYKAFSKLISFFVKIIKKYFSLLSNIKSKSIFKSWILGFFFVLIIVNAILVLLIANSWGFTTFLLTVLFIALNSKVFYEVFKFLSSLQKIIYASDSVSYASDVKTLELDEISPSLHELSSNIIDIQGGIRNAVNKALKGEQMKTALITNVSHDLKTPLTSIITYVDLLKKEKFTSDNAKEYLQVLDEKSYRLKNLIEDIIEVNKASTGNMIVNKDKVDFNELINQSMGEYQFKIDDSNLEFKINVPKEATFIEADSKSMWRILENLMENALKYSADNSRIYVDIIKNEKHGILTIKNMSKLSLDISPDQLTERFVRGDSARSSEGSGLGLSIAQSLSDIQGGNFEVIIDGDLFKVVVNMPLWDDEND